MVCSIGFAIALAAYAFDLVFDHACALAQARASDCLGNGWQQLTTFIIEQFSQATMMGKENKACLRWGKASIHIYSRQKGTKSKSTRCIEAMALMELELEWMWGGVIFNQR